MTDVNVNLNVHELGIIISALKLLEISDENRIAVEYGSVSALQSKMYFLWEQMDTTETGTRNDVVPSF